MPDVVLIVDDEEPIRKTFRDWLIHSNLGIEVLDAADVETALKLASEHPVDLAILDWNLGSGSDGLQLLEDLIEFRPHLVAILVTGFAHQATPLDALRMGIRDYLDKNQDLTRDVLLKSVRKQLERIRPAKRERQLQLGLTEFRNSVEKMMPLLQSARAINSSVGLPSTVSGLVKFLVEITQSEKGVLVARHFAQDGVEHFVAFFDNGEPVSEPLVPFAQSLAATIVSLGERTVIDSLNPSAFAPAIAQPFEKSRKSLLAVPMNVAPTTRVVIELFDKPSGYTSHDVELVRTAAEFGNELLKQAITDRQSSRLLVDALEAALNASERLGEHLSGENSTTDALPEDPLKAATEAIRRNLNQDRTSSIDAETTITLAETIRDFPSSIH